MQIDSDEDVEADVQEELAASLSKEMQIFQKFHSTASPDKEAERQDKLVKDGTKTFVRHTVVTTDTIAGLALKYGVKAADIKRANNLIGDSIFERKHLDIPNPTRIPDSVELSGGLPKCGKEEIAISRFAATARCDKAEAKYYLTDYDWDMDKAMAAFMADAEWAKAHPFPKDKRV